MKLFAYISLKDLEKILSGDLKEIGIQVGENENRVNSQSGEDGTKYIELFENLEDVSVMQQFNIDNPEYAEGGVLVKVGIPKRLLESRKGCSIFRILDGNQESFFELQTYLVKSGKFRTENFVDAVFDRECMSSVEELEDELNFKCGSRSLGE